MPKRPCRYDRGGARQSHEPPSRRTTTAAAAAVKEKAGGTGTAEHIPSGGAASVSSRARSAATKLSSARSHGESRAISCRGLMRAACGPPLKSRSAPPPSPPPKPPPTTPAGANSGWSRGSRGWHGAAITECASTQKATAQPASNASSRRDATPPVAAGHEACQRRSGRSGGDRVSVSFMIGVRAARISWRAAMAMATLRVSTLVCLDATVTIHGKT